MSTDTTTMESILDLAAAMENMDGDSELLQEIMAIFLETAEEQLQCIANLIQAGDVGEVATQVHGMKGAASNFCAGRFVASALRLEQLAKEGILEGAPDLLHRLCSDFEEVKEVVQFVNWDEVGRNWNN